MTNVEDVVTAQQAAELCGMTKRNFHYLDPKPPVVIVGGRKMYRKQDVIEWNRQRLASLQRHWKKHADWAEKHPA